MPEMTTKGSLSKDQTGRSLLSGSVSGSWVPELQSQILHLLAVRCQASHLTSLHLFPHLCNGD